jgi:hypothetical protein
MSKMFSGMSEDQEQNGARGVFSAEPVEALVEIGIGMAVSPIAPSSECPK